MIGYDGYLQITTSFPTIAIPDVGFSFLTTSSNMKDKTPHAATLRDMCFIVTAILYIGGFLSEHRNACPATTKAENTASENES